MASGTFIGIEIGGSKLQLVAGDAAGRIETRFRASVNPAAGAEGIRRQIQTGLRELTSGRSIAGVAVGFGGPVDVRTGRISRSHQIAGWEGFALRDWLAEVTGARVVVENDANTAALGEATSGAGVGYDPVFYVTLGSGVGGGLVTRGRIYHGAAPGEAEFGHLLLDRDGTTIESRCSGWSIDARIRRLQLDQSESLLAGLTRGMTGGEARYLAAALQQNDPVARRILNELASDLALGLSHVTHLFHPQVVVLGGGLSLLGEPLRAAVAKVLPPLVMKVFAPGPEIRLAKLAEDAVPIGALHLAADQERNLSTTSTG